jgi:hypothetical protein
MNISGACVKRYGHNLKVKNITITIASPSIYPPGVKIEANIFLGKTKIIIDGILSPFSNTIRMENVKLNTEDFKDLFGEQESLQGIFNINTLLTMKAGQLTEGQFQIKSNNLNIPRQSIQNFQIPNMNVGAFSFRGQVTGKNSITIRELIVGNGSAPMNAMLRGNIKINAIDFNMSMLNLNGGVKFAPEFIQSFGIINFFISGKNAVEGFYQVQLDGALGAPQAKIL